ncbi:MAG: lysine--tRNA ligase [Candidatus Bathyarchaeota archaeon]|nr:MAG: lysine--tRNA ligase [Candidatus Bathyarchaeota archaeon]
MRQIETHYDHWIKKVVEDLKRRPETPLVLSTGKTPSGPIHIGICRELLYCSAFEELLKKDGLETRFLFFIDDFDPIKSFPPNIPKEFAKHKEYIGRPMSDVPCPYGDCRSWAEHFSRELLDSLGEFNVFPEAIMTHEFYETEEAKSAIRTALRKVGTLRDILGRIVGPTLSNDKRSIFEKQLETWTPCTVVCESCGSLKTVDVESFDLERDVVRYSCGNCGDSAEVPIASGRIKLKWRIDWPTKWAYFKVSCEPAGKDHCVKGGAYDTGEAICSEVYEWNPPYKVAFEWLTLGKRAMKTHKGISFTPSEWLKVSPPDVLRYLIFREEPARHISFYPERVPFLVDDFEHIEAVFFDRESTRPNEDKDILGFLYSLCRPNVDLTAPPVRLPYRYAAVLAQLSPLLGEEGVVEKSSKVVSSIYGIDKLSPRDKTEISMRLSRAGYWVENYAPEADRFEIAEEIPKGVKDQIHEREREALNALKTLISQKEWVDQELQNGIFSLGKEIYGSDAKHIFEIVYLVLLGQPYGPRLAPLLLSLDRSWLLKRFEKAIVE